MNTMIRYGGILLFLAVLSLPANGRAAAASGGLDFVFSLQGEASGFSMQAPTAVFVDESVQRYYVTDSGRNRLLSFDKDGKFLNAFNAGGDLQTPVDLMRAADGRLLLVEKGANSLTFVDPKAREIKRHPVTYQGKPLFPQRVEAADGRMYLLDKASGKVFALNDSLEATTAYGCSDCRSGFADFKVRKGMIWALAALEKTIYRFSATGAAEEKIRLEDGVRFPYALELGPRDDIYIADRHGGTITTYSASGRRTGSYLQPGNAKGQLSYARDLLFDPWGRLCVVEEGNGRVEVFTGARN